MKLTIDSWHNHDCTLGRLTAGKLSCFTLELPWHGNSRNISCIPAGNYSAKKYQSPKFGTVILIEDVPNRSMIEIHAGNYTRQIQGCILVGDGIKYLDGDSIPDVTNSKKTLAKLLDKLPDSFEVEINRAR